MRLKGELLLVPSEDAIPLEEGEYYPFPVGGFGCLYR